MDLLFEDIYFALANLADFFSKNYIYFSVLFSLILSRYIRKIRNFWLYSLVSFPGTILHELAHAIVGFALNAKPVSFTIFPKRTANYWVFGSVSFSNINNLNALPTSMAPFLILLIPYFISNFIGTNELSLLESALIFFFVALVSHSSIPSGQDFKVMFSKPLGLVLWLSFLFFSVLSNSN